jgi:SAM-dependent methyltransferase
MATPRRLLFGEVADLYDLHRPAYPAPLVDDLIAQSEVGEDPRALEVGAGTGKATRMFAAHGVAVLAIEPSAEMAELARDNCADYPQVEIIQSDFERWDPAGERFGLIYAAQAWHWIDPELRYRRARAALRPGGVLAAFWNRPAWGSSELRAALLAAYRAIAPDMPANGPMHPANRLSGTDEDWVAEIGGVAEFSDPVVRPYEWSQDYSAPAYAGLLGTLSEFRLLDEGTRTRLLGAVRDVIDEHGGTLTMPMVTRAHLARAA